MRDNFERPLFVIYGAPTITQIHDAVRVASFAQQRTIVLRDEGKPSVENESWTVLRYRFKPAALQKRLMAYFGPTLEEPAIRSTHTHDLDAVQLHASDPHHIMSTIAKLQDGDALRITFGTHACYARNTLPRGRTLEVGMTNGIDNYSLVAG